MLNLLRAAAFSATILQQSCRLKNYTKQAKQCLLHFYRFIEPKQMLDLRLGFSGHMPHGRPANRPTNCQPVAQPVAHPVYRTAQPKRATLGIRSPSDLGRELPFNANQART
jgi:hypothetical protein